MLERYLVDQVEWALVYRKKFSQDLQRKLLNVIKIFPLLFLTFKVIRLDGFSLVLVQL